MTSIVTLHTMLNNVLEFLKNRLNTYLRLRGNVDDAQEDQVVFLIGQDADSLKLKLGAISILVINLEQENVLRASDPYTRTLSNGALQKIQPDIRLNVYVLFVAHYQGYEDSLRNLSAIIQYFQSHRLFAHQDSPELSEKIEQLIVELVTLPFSAQNEVWSSLRLPYHPSALYKVKMVVFQDETPREAPEITEKVIGASLCDI